MKKLIKIASVVLCLVLVVTAFAACGTNKKEETKLSGSLTTILENINTEAKVEVMTLNTAEIESANADYFTGLTEEQYKNYVVAGASSEPMMSSVAFSSVIVELKDAKDADTVAKLMLDNINIRKWICVEAEKLTVMTSGKYVYLIMCGSDMIDAMTGAFKNLAGVVDNTLTK